MASLPLMTKLAGHAHPASGMAARLFLKAEMAGLYSVMRSNPAKLLPDVGCYCLISINKKHSVGSGVFLWTPPVF
jgi:hypothetical protein